MTRITLTTSEQAALELEALGIPFEREVRFHTVRKWRFDYAYTASKLAVEVEGGLYRAAGQTPCPVCGKVQSGAHGTATGIERDIEKGNAAIILGWRVLRVTGKNVHELQGLVSDTLAMIAKGR